MGLLSNFSVLVLTFILSITPTRALPIEGNQNLIAQASTGYALLYAYPLLAFQKEYASLGPWIGVNHPSNARQLYTSQARSTVKPNADTVIRLLRVILVAMISTSTFLPFQSTSMIYCPSMTSMVITSPILGKRI
jgi:hypothetical protein